MEEAALRSALVPAALHAGLPLGFFAVLAGWAMTEVGRQPWTVYGLLRTAIRCRLAHRLDVAAVPHRLQSRLPPGVLGRDRDDVRIVGRAGRGDGAREIESGRPRSPVTRFP